MDHARFAATLAERVLSRAGYDPRQLRDPHTGEWADELGVGVWALLDKLREGEGIYYHGSPAALRTGGDRELFLAPSKGAALGYLEGRPGRVYAVRLNPTTRVAREDQLRAAAGAVYGDTDAHFGYQPYTFELADDPKIRAWLAKQGFAGAQFTDLGPDNAYEHPTVVVWDSNTLQLEGSVAIPEHGRELATARGPRRYTLHTRARKPRVPRAGGGRKGFDKDQLRDPGGEEGGRWVKSPASGAVDQIARRIVDKAFGDSGDKPAPKKATRPRATPSAASTPRAPRKAAKAAPKAAAPAKKATPTKATAAKATTAPSSAPVDFDEKLTHAATGPDALTSAPTLVTYDETADEWTVPSLPARDRTRAGKAVATWWDRGQDINEYLRGGPEAYKTGRYKLTPAAIRRTATAVDRLYEHSRLSRPVVVWRGFGGRTTFGADPDAWPDDLTGREWVDPGYVSTAASRDEASRFTLGGSAGPMDRRGVMARLLLPEGAPVLSLSEMEATELLTSRGWTFRVVRDHGWVDDVRPSGVYKHRLIDVEATPPPTVPTGIPEATPAKVRKAAAKKAAAGIADAAVGAKKSAPVAKKAVWSTSYEDRLSQLEVAAHVPARPVGERRGITGRAEVQDRGGVRVVHKTNTGEDAVRDTDAELLAAQVRNAIGGQAPAVVRVGRTATIEEFIDGESGNVLVDDPTRLKQVVDSNSGRLVGLGDVLTGDLDRGPQNLILTPDGQIVSIDHEAAFRTGAEFPFDVADDFSRPFLGGTNDLSPDDARIIRTRLEALRPEFERLGHADWHQAMMARFDRVERAASGSGSVIDRPGPTKKAAAGIAAAVVGDSTPAKKAAPGKAPTPAKKAAAPRKAVSTARKPSEYATGPLTTREVDGETVTIEPRRGVFGNTKQTLAVDIGETDLGSIHIGDDDSVVAFGPANGWRVPFEHATVDDALRALVAAYRQHNADMSPEQIRETAKRHTRTIIDGYDPDSKADERIGWTHWSVEKALDRQAELVPHTTLGLREVSYLTADSRAGREMTSSGTIAQYNHLAGDSMWLTPALRDAGQLSRMRADDASGWHSPTPDPGLPGGTVAHEFGHHVVVTIRNRGLEDDLADELVPVLERAIGAEPGSLHTPGTEFDKDDINDALIAHRDKIRGLISGYAAQPSADRGSQWDELLAEVWQEYSMMGTKGKKKARPHIIEMGDILARLSEQAAQRE